MSAPNQAPIFSRVASCSKDNSTGMAQLVTVANNDYVGTHANAFLIWTADPTNGGYIDFLRAKAGGANVATVLRLYLNNGLTNGTAANNAFIGEWQLPATVATANTATPDLVYPLGLTVDPSFRIYGCYGTATAAGWAITPFGGKF